METHDNHGLSDVEDVDGKMIITDAKAYQNPHMKLCYIEHVLLPEFLEKYPDGILTGWATNLKFPR